MKNIREIIAVTATLFSALKRVKLESLGNPPDASLVQRLAGHLQAFCIVNRRKHAQQLFQQLGEAEGNHHLGGLAIEHSGAVPEAVTEWRDDHDTQRQVLRTGLAPKDLVEGLEVVERAFGRAQRRRPSMC